MASLSQTLTDSAKDAHSVSESNNEDAVEYLAQSKKKSEIFTKAVLIQRCKSVQQKAKKEVNFEGIPNDSGETRHQE
eukprot:15336417-Ditylum_brightwellii.AAC.1